LIFVVLSSWDVSTIAAEAVSLSSSDVVELIAELVNLFIGSVRHICKLLE
jgi:hypothetical protein